MRWGLTLILKSGKSENAGSLKREGERERES